MKFCLTIADPVELVIPVDRWKSNKTLEKNSDFYLKEKNPKQLFAYIIYSCLNIWIRPHRLQMLITHAEILLFCCCLISVHTSRQHFPGKHYWRCWSPWFLWNWTSQLTLVMIYMIKYAYTYYHSLCRKTGHWNCDTVLYWSLTGCKLYQIQNISSDRYIFK